MYFVFIHERIKTEGPMNLTSSFWRLTEGRQHVAELQIQKENLDITM